MSSAGVWYRVLTPPGAGAIAELELAGPEAERLLAECLDRAPPPSGRAGVREVLGASEERDVIDEVVVIHEASGRFSLACHGGLGVVAAIRARLERGGAWEETGPPSGESRGRCEEEAWRFLPKAPTRLACQVLLRQAEGQLRDEVRRLSESLSPVESALPRLARLLASATLGQRLLVPARVVLWGRPNAGKSSLLNALLGRERVIVTPLAGTTRDAVEVGLELEGIPIVLVDTAGQRSSSDPLEAEGVRLAQEEGSAADLSLVVIDGTAEEEPPSLPEGRRSLRVWNKVDLGACRAKPEGALAVSAESGAGLEELRSAIRASLLQRASALDPTGPVLFTPRQAGLVAGAIRALERQDEARARRCLEAILGGEPSPGPDRDP